MTVQMEATQLAVLIAAVIVAFWLINRVQLRTITRHLDEQDTRMEDLEKKLTSLHIEVGRDYVKRGDHIRDVASLKAQFSALANAVERKLDDQTKLMLQMIKRELRK